MGEKCGCCCCFGWFSGFFATPAIMHLLRIIFKWDVAFNGNPVAMKTSWIVFIVSGLLAIIFAVIGCKRHKSQTGATC